MSQPVKAAPAIPFTVGTPDVHGPLAVFPVFATAAPRLEYVSFAEAAGLGAAIKEVADRASVNDLVVHNPLDVPVLLYEGEEVRGAQQDRTLDVSVLVPARSEIRVPVSCVEHGRWDGSRHGELFAAAPTAAFPELRRAKNRAARMSGAGRADQGEVWNVVADKASRHEACAPTGAMRDVYAHREGSLRGLREAIVRRDGQIGAIAAINGAICIADVVGRADVFAALHGPLVSGYALDALEFVDKADAFAPVPDLALLELFLSAALTDAVVRRPGVGLGDEHRFASFRAEGIRLEHDGEIVALTAFPGERHEGRVARASRRRA